MNKSGGLNDQQIDSMPHRAGAPACLKLLLKSTKLPHSRDQMKTLISIVLTFKTNEAQMHSLEKTADIVQTLQTTQALRQNSALKKERKPADCRTPLI